MTITSYAQNLEDVLLWRALGHISGGHYIDIGAQDPVVDSVSCLFYERGWRGLHVEPVPAYAERLRHARPDEIVIQAAITHTTGLTTIFEFRDTGLSTGVREIAEKHMSNGFGGQEITVPGLTLDEIFAREAGRETHWLKIDVEGAEQQVLEGWTDPKARPWIVVIESTIPLSPIESHSQWEPMLISKGYQFVHFDGLNRFYISQDHAELRSAFKSGPNVFDNFTLSETANSCFNSGPNSRIQALEARVQRQTEEADARQALLQAEFAEQLASGRAEMSRLSQSFSDKERDLNGRLRDSQQALSSMAARLDDVIRAMLEKEKSIAESNAAREREFTERLKSWQVEALIATQKLASRERELNALLSKSQIETSQALLESKRAQDKFAAEYQLLLDREREAERKFAYDMEMVRDDIEKIRSSLSWRITSPFRWIASGLSGRPPVKVRSLTVDSAINVHSAARVGGKTEGESVQPQVNNGDHAVVTIPLGVAPTLAALLEYDDGEFVECAYRTLLQRAPDPAGRSFYLNRLRGGVTKNKIVAEIAASAEATFRNPETANRFLRDPAIRSTVSAKYRRFMEWIRRRHRPPPLASIGDKLADHAADAHTSMDALLRLEDEEFVRASYLALLGREPDPDGCRHYVDRIRKGDSRLAIVAALRNSPEGAPLHPNVQGLELALRRHKRSTIPVIGRLFEASSRRSLAQSTIVKLGVQIDSLKPPSAITDMRTSAGTDQNTVETSITSLARQVDGAPAPPVSFSRSTGTEAAERGPAERAHPVERLGTSVYLDAEGKGPNDEDNARAALTWSFAESTENSQASALILEHVPRGLVKIGEPYHTSPQSAAIDVLGLVQFPSHRISIDHPRAILVGHDWSETGYPAEWIEEINSKLDGVACTTRHTQKILADHGIGVPLEVVGFGVDHWQTLASALDYKAPGKRFRFLHVSACGLDDGVDLLIESYGRVFDSDDDVSLIVAPSEMPYEQLALRLSQLHAANPRFPHVTIVAGELDDFHLKALYEQCAVFVAPGRACGFGLPLALAFVSGLPAITTAWGGHLDYCDENSCWLVDYKFEHSRSAHHLRVSVWAKPISDHLDDSLWAAYQSTPLKRAEMADVGRRKLADKFTWSDVASRLANFARSMQLSADPTAIKRRVGWVTTWNIKCGIAGYVKHMLKCVPSDDFIIFAAKDDAILGPDPSNCIRCWTSGKEFNGLARVAEELRRNSVNDVVVQFNYGFFNHIELNGFIKDLARKGVRVFIDLHATINTLDVENFRLEEILPALRECCRILAHGPEDMNRLKTLGLINNVMLFPHGIIDRRRSDGVPKGRGDGPPLIASFGFSFGNKGLLELVEAVHHLRSQGMVVRLRMLNAQHENSESATVVEAIRNAIVTYELQQEVEFRTDFIDDDVCLELLSEADLVVNPYQRTGESASGAVQFAIASGRPVLVTPLPIFDDLGDAVFRMKGTSPLDIAAGIAETLKAIDAKSEAVTHVETSASQWVQAHSASQQGVNLMRTVCAFAKRGNQNLSKNREHIQ